MNNNFDDIIIIGAGIAGMAAGCYAQMNGYKTKIFEMHNLPGGLCTAWEQKGYVFDGCIYYMFGTESGQPFNQIWQELGVFQKRTFFHFTEFMQIQDRDGKKLIVYHDPDQLEEHLCELSPSDAKLSKQFCAGIRAFSDFDLTLLQRKPKKLMGLSDWGKLGLETLPYLGPLAKWGFTSMDSFAHRFRDPFLRRAIPLMFIWPGIPAVVGMTILAYANQKNAGFPAGGSLEFARTIEKRYLELGGEIHYKSQVERVLVENYRATGVRLYNNEEHRSRRIISACDGHTTIFNLLGEEFANQKIKNLYDGHLPLYSQLQVSLGVNRDFSDQPGWVNYLLDQSTVIAGEERRNIGVKHYCFDPSLSPKGKSVIIVTMSTSYDYWQRIYGRPIYHHEQIQEAELLIDLLEEFYPGIKADIEVTDVATPLSYERFTGNWQGSICGFLLTKATMPMMILGMRKTLTGLSNFYMTGQWVEPGGSLPIVAMSGRNIIQQICDEDKKEFTTLLPS